MPGSAVLEHPPLIPKAPLARRHGHSMLLGSTTPRLYPRPLAAGPPGPCGCGCSLTPFSSRGFEALEFATTVLKVDLLPWQRWWLIHALETVPGTGPGSVRGRRLRFRVVLTLVGRQQGKTTLLKIVSLYFMFLGYAKLVLGSAQALDIAKEAWQGAVDLAESVPELSARIKSVRRTNGQDTLTLTHRNRAGKIVRGTDGPRYRITATSRSAGRGLSVDVLIMDELREQRDWLAWGALSKTTMARPGALILPTSNAGDSESVVLNTLRAQAIAGADESLALFEWSAPDGCEMDDPLAWAAAMPGLGITISESAVRSALATDPPAVFRTELLCQHVDVMETAIAPEAWAACADPTGTLAGVRDRIVLVVEPSPDGKHVTAVLAAPVKDGHTRVEVAGAWTSTDAAMAALPNLVTAIRPRAVAWYPSGPGAVFTADMERLYDYGDSGPNAGRRKPRNTPDLHRVTGGDVSAACQGLVDVVATRRVLHPADPLLDSQVVGSQRKDVGDGFRFVRIGAAHVDAVYALAGAVHIARTLPPPARRPMVY